MKLLLRVESLLVVNWLIYVSYNTNDDCRGHIGCMVSLVKGGVLILPLKQNFNVKSSTEV